MILKLLAGLLGVINMKIFTDITEFRKKHSNALNSIEAENLMQYPNAKFLGAAVEKDQLNSTQTYTLINVNTFWDIQNLDSVLWASVNESSEDDPDNDLSLDEYGEAEISEMAPNTLEI